MFRGACCVHNFKGEKVETMPGGNNFPFAFKPNRPNNEAAKTRRQNLLRRYRLKEERNLMQKDYARLDKDYTNAIAMRLNPNHDLRPTLDDMLQKMRLKNKAKHDLVWFNMTNPGIAAEGGSRKKRRNTLKNRKN